MTIAQRNDLDEVTIENGGKFYFLASWKHPRDGDFGILWNIAMNARAATANMLDLLENIRMNERLSDEAKRDDSKEVAMKALTTLGAQQRKLNEFEAGVDNERLKLAQIPDADAAQAVVDVALADYFRALSGENRMGMIAELAAGSQARMVDAVLRLPAVLFGLTDEVRSVIEANAIARRAPDEVRILADKAQAVRMTQQVISKCVKIVTQSSMLDMQEQITSLGRDAWQPHVRGGAPDAMAALANRYLAKAT